MNSKCPLLNSTRKIIIEWENDDRKLPFNEYIRRHYKMPMRPSELSSDDFESTMYAVNEALYKYMYFDEAPKHD